jgi:hypothetical protein
MIAAIVVPFGSYSIFSTADCLEDDAGDFDDTAFEVVAVDEAGGFDRTAAPLLAERFAVRKDLRAVGFGFDLLVAIWFSLGINDSILCCH